MPIGRVFFALAALILLFVAELGFGPAGLTLAETLSALTAEDSSGASYIVWELRMPRALMACMAGAGLAISGATLQGLFRNPLADPGLLGVSAGSALGAVVAIVLLGSGSFVALALGSVAGAGAVLFVLLSLSVLHADNSRVLLAGIALNATIAAFIAVLSVIASEAELRSATFWMLGSTARAEWLGVAVLAVLLPACLVALVIDARKLDILAVGESAAWQLGVDVSKLRFRMLLVTALLTAGVVSLCGVIGFVGLIVPHVLRLLFGPLHRTLILESAAWGAVLLMAADLLSRMVAVPAELPIGIITALVGGPFFLVLLLRREVLR
ncbi:MAG: iron complex transport system permease protein [Pseudoalteromonas tetraodonis]|jgi:iron complex transport system permease protein